MQTHAEQPKDHSAMPPERHATGERFDPTVHEAISTRTADGVEAGTVVDTLERGYRLDGQVLRPARVVVSE